MDCVHNTINYMHQVKEKKVYVSGIQNIVKICIKLFITGEYLPKTRNKANCTVNKVSPTV